MVVAEAAYSAKKVLILTITVAVIVPDGIVIAADSLAIISSPLSVMCPECEETTQVKAINCPQCQKLFTYQTPTSHSKFAQKVFKIDLNNRSVGVAVDGMGMVNGRTIESHIRTFSRTKPTEIETVEGLATELTSYFHEEFIKDYGGVENIPEFKEPPLGLQVVGYDSQEATKGQLISCSIDKEPGMKAMEEYLINLRGDHYVVGKLLSNLRAEIPFNLIPIQDAIDLAIFLIETTIRYQRFEKQISTCGGPIDVAVVTPSDYFWIQQKHLLGQRTIEKE